MQKDYDLRKVIGPRKPNPYADGGTAVKTGVSMWTVVKITLTVIATIVAVIVIFCVAVMLINSGKKSLEESLEKRIHVSTQDEYDSYSRQNSTTSSDQLRALSAKGLSDD